MIRWLSTIARETDEAEHQRLRRCGLDPIERLLFAEIAQPIKRKPGVELYRVEVQPDEVYFIKRTGNPTPARIAKALLKCIAGRGVAHTEAIRVQHAAKSLDSIGIPVMRVVASAEQRLLGVAPVRGCMLAEAVRGDEVSRLYKSTDDEGRRAIMEAIGRVAGGMHGHGVYVQMRVRDFIRSDPDGTPSASDANAPAPPRADDHLVMIDLDFKGRSPHPGAFRPEEAAKLVAHCTYLHLRTGARLDQGQARAFLVGYRFGMRQVGRRPARGWLRSARQCLERQLLEHHRDAARRALFPKAPMAGPLFNTRS